MEDENDKLALVKEAGIVGMGGAGFPTGVKIGTDLKGGYVLVNAAECEPGLRHNVIQLEEKADITIRGLKYCMEISNASKGIIAIKKKNEKAVQILRDAIKDDDSLTIHLLPDIYPMGEERAVVRECLDKLLDPTQLPSAADAVVINCETLLRIAEAIEEKKPCYSKNMTVIGKLNGGNEPHVYGYSGRDQRRRYDREGRRHRGALWRDHYGRTVYREVNCVRRTGYEDDRRYHRNDRIP